ncbi:MAG: hypothetical protein E7607_02765 [Ruminococcaceae bacterium]|nr:hypothetical protein [Oscillospiraceae bacterium]
MKKIPCKISFCLLLFGIFTVLCQLVMILLHIDFVHPTASPSVLLHTYANFIQFPLASLALTVGGALLIDYVLLRISDTE